jgi:hypothetical protein
MSTTQLAKRQAGWENGNKYTDAPHLHSKLAVWLGDTLPIPGKHNFLPDHIRFILQ